MNIYPLKLEPVISRRLWGGNRLQDWLGLSDPGEGEPYAESWQVYGGNTVINGPLEGMTLQDAAGMLGPDLLGTRPIARYGERFPLLAKFLDAAQDLSIQVHPDDAYAARFEADSGHLGKAEAWLILHAEPGASVWWGFRQSVGRERVKAAVADGSLTELLNRMPVQAGDVIYNPPGTVHAVGAGIMLYEIQQSSDLTYRLYDFGRRDARGQPRELHVNRALEVSNLEGGLHARIPARQLRAGQRELLRSEYFVLQELSASGGPSVTTSAGSVELLTCTRGAATVEHEHGITDLGAGTSLVLPAALGHYSVSGDGQVLRAYMPDV